MPYLLQTPYDVVKVTTIELNQMWNDYAMKNGGFKIIGWTYSNFRYITNSKRPIKNLADVKGLKNSRAPQPDYSGNIQGLGRKPRAHGLV